MKSHLGDRKRPNREPVTAHLGLPYGWEVEVPAGGTEVEWFLMTDRAVSAIAGMRQAVGYYPRRPVLDAYRKALEPGCGVEKLPHRTRAAQSAAVGITSVLAVALLELRDRARARSVRTPQRRAW